MKKISFDRIKIGDFIKFFFVLLSILTSGSVLVYYKNFGPNIFYLMIISIFILYVLFGKTKIKADFKWILMYTLLLLIFPLFSIFINRESNSIKNYLGDVLRVGASFAVVWGVTITEYKKNYLNILYFLAVNSLIFYTLGLLYPGFILNLPVIFDDVGTPFSSIIVHNYMHGILGVYRNAGIFWEPGAFQAFLNLALIFEFSKKEKYNKNRILVFTLAIITTFSTTGYILLFLNYSILFFRIKKKKKYLYLILFTIIFISSGLFKSVILDKVGIFGTKAKSLSGQIRKEGAKADMKIFEKFPIFGAGAEKYFSLYKDVVKPVRAGGIAEGSSNSFTIMLAINGIIYFMLRFFPIILFLVDTSSKKQDVLIMILGIMMLLYAENLLSKLLFIIISMYGINFSYSKNRKSFVKLNLGES